MIHAGLRATYTLCAGSATEGILVWNEVSPKFNSSQLQSFYYVIGFFESNFFQISALAEIVFVDCLWTDKGKQEKDHISYWDSRLDAWHGVICP